MSAATLIVMQAPSPAPQTIKTRNGNTYTPDSSGIVSAYAIDVPDLIAAGFTISAEGGGVVAVAAAGNAQGNAAALGQGVNVVSAADGTKGVVLPTAVANAEVEVINTGSAVLKVYPATGAAINALSANAAFSVGGYQSAKFSATAALQWYVPAIAGSVIAANIADPAGGGTVDTEARAAIVDILNALEGANIMLPA